MARRRTARRMVVRAATATATTGVAGLLAVGLAPGTAAAEGGDGRFAPGEYQRSVGVADGRGLPVALTRPEPIALPRSTAEQLVGALRDADRGICVAPGQCERGPGRDGDRSGTIAEPRRPTLSRPGSAAEDRQVERAPEPAPERAARTAPDRAAEAVAERATEAAPDRAAEAVSRRGTQTAPERATDVAPARTTEKQDRLGGRQTTAHEVSRPSPERFGRTSPGSEIGVVDTPGVRDQRSQIDVDDAPDRSVTGIDVGYRGVGGAFGVTEDRNVQVSVGVRTPGVTVGDIGERSNGLNGSVKGSVDLGHKNSVSAGVDIAVSPAGATTVTGKFSAEFDYGTGPREFEGSFTWNPDGTLEWSVSNSATIAGTYADVTFDSNGKVSAKSKGLGADFSARLTADYTFDPARVAEAISAGVRSALGFQDSAPKGDRIGFDLGPSAERFGRAPVDDIGVVDTPGMREARAGLDGHDPSGASSGRGRMSDENADRGGSGSGSGSSASDSSSGSQGSGLDGDDSTGASSGRGRMSDENADRDTAGGSDLDGNDPTGASSGSGRMSDENADRN